MDRFSVQLAAEKLDADQRHRPLRLGRALRAEMNLQEFNRRERELDAIIFDAAAEAFLDRTLRPLHTIFRRTGNVYLAHLGGEDGLDQTIDCHLDPLDAVEPRDPARASSSANSDA